MSVYSVSYDLNNPGQKYEKIHEVLKSFSGYYHIMDSTWLISTSFSAAQVCDKLTPHLDSNDKMFISKVNANEYQGWLENDVWDWLRKHL